MFNYSGNVFNEMNLDGSELLPNEIWIKVFQHLPPKCLFHSISHTNQKWRHLIRNNKKRLPLIRVHVRVSIIDVDYCEDRNDGYDPMIQYTFTAYDTCSPDYSMKRRSCIRGNDKSSRAVFVTHNRRGELNAELETSEEESYKPEKIDSDVAITLLSNMCVEGARFEVLKQGRKLVNRVKDERFFHAIQFCEERCAKVHLRSLLLNSQNPNFAWILADDSVRRLLDMTSLESLTIENMPGLDVFTGKEHIHLRRLRSLRMRMDPRHKQEIENTLWLDIDGDFLLALVPFAVRNLELNVFAEVSNAITGISANHMCEFVKRWRGLLHPWHIKYISFNTTTSISEFRTAASLRSLFTKHHLADIPYCRFRTHHPSDPHVVLELTCYGNGNATQWSIRSGYTYSAVRTR